MYENFGAPSRTRLGKALRANRYDFAALHLQNLLVFEPVVAPQLFWFSSLKKHPAVSDIHRNKAGYDNWRAQQDSNLQPTD